MARASGRRPRTKGEEATSMKAIMKETKSTGMESSPGRAETSTKETITMIRDKGTV